MPKQVLFKVWNSIVTNEDDRNRFLTNIDKLLQLPADLVPRVKPLFTDPRLNVQRLEKLEQEAANVNDHYTLPRFVTYFAIELTDQEDAKSLVDTLRSHDATIEDAYEQPPGVEPVNPGQNPEFNRQGYVTKAGINIDRVWPSPNGTGKPGLDGVGIQFADVERGWTLDHRDLMSANGRSRVELDRAGENNPNQVIRRHGTAVVGIVAAVDNNRNIIGIAPNVARVRAYSYWHSDRAENPLETILLAASELGAGDVLLIERCSVGTLNGQVAVLPQETERFAFPIIQNATVRGITVVEPAGNDGVNLDRFRFPDGRALTDPTRDSGAIIVGGAGQNRSRAAFSNFGDRVDCFAWGEQVFTLDDPAFNGTSAASAIIAGVAVALQGYARQRRRAVFSSSELRNLLRDPALNTSSLSGRATDKIGVMPNVARIVDSLET